MGKRQLFGGWVWLCYEWEDSLGDMLTERVRENVLKMVLLAIPARYILCSDRFRERACLGLWICADNSGIGLSSETRFGC